MDEILENEIVDYSDKDNLIKIVEYDRRQHDFLIGYRQNNRVVYASVPIGLDEGLAKQQGYEQVRKALAYEQTLDVPSIEGSDMEPIEVFTPAEPVVKEITIHGDTFVNFGDDSPSKTVEFVASAIDQYGEPIESEFNWIGVDDGILTVDNADGAYGVSATSDNVTAAINVIVHAYVAPSPPQPEIDYEKLALYEAIAGLEERMARAEGGRE